MLIENNTYDVPTKKFSPLSDLVFCLVKTNINLGSSIFQLASSIMSTARIMYQY